MQDLIKQLANEMQIYHYKPGERGLWCMLIYRLGHWRLHQGWLLRKVYAFIYYPASWVARLILGLDIPPAACIGQGTRIDHGQGLVISGYSQIGSDCILRQNVTIGLRHTNQLCAPRIGNNVDIGAGACILGDIQIGNGCRIGAGAIVLQSIPDFHTAAGNPARIISGPMRLECV